MTTITTKKLVRLSLKKMGPFEHRLLRAISKGQGSWSDLTTRPGYLKSVHLILDLDLIEAEPNTKDGWLITSTGRLVLEEVDARRL